MGGLAGGLLSGLQGVQAFNQQRRENQQANRRLDIYSRQVGALERQFGLQEDEAALQARIRANDDLVESLDTGGYVSTDRMSLNTSKLQQDIEAGDQTAIALGLQMVTNSGILPEGSTASGFVRDESGAYTVNVRNADGSMGVITVDGSSEPDSVVKQFSIGEIAGLGNTLYRTKILPGSSTNATALRAQLGRVEADAEADRLTGLLEEETAVVNALPPGGAQRAAMSAISAAGTQEERADVISKIGADAGVDTPLSNRIGATPAPATGDETEIMTRGERKAGKTESREARLEREIKQAEEELAAARRRGGKRRNVPSAVKQRVDAAQAKVDSLKRELGGVRTTVPTAEEASSFVAAAPPAAKQSLASVEDVVVGKTDAELDAAIEAGDVTVTPEAQAAVAQTLRSERITELKDLLRLNRKDRAIARAVILATESDPTIRQQMSKEMTNIFETGTASMSGVQAVEADLAQQRIDVNRGNLAQNIREFTTGLATDDIEAAVKAGREMSRTTTGIFTNEDGSFNLNADTANQFFNQMLPEYKTMFDSLSSDLSPRTRQAVFRGLSQGISLGMASLAAEEEGGLSETLKSFFRSDAVDTASAGDFNLERVIISRWGRDSEGNPVPEQFSYTDSRGNVVDEGIDATLIQDLNQGVYDVLTAAASTNKNSATVE